MWFQPLASGLLIRGSRIHLLLLAMNLYQIFVSRPMRIVPYPRNKPFHTVSYNVSPVLKRVFEFSSFGANHPLTMARASQHHLWLETQATSPETATKMESLEESIEKVIYGCRFMIILGVFGSLIGSILCFVKGCSYVVASFANYFYSNSKVIILLVEAIDVYLLGTVMLVFGMGLYELFISNLGPARSSSEGLPQGSNLFGLFALKGRPQWLEIKSVNELKTKLGHVIVMLLLIGFLEKSKMALIYSPLDLLSFSASVLLCSGCLYLLSKLKE